ncbi:MAG: helix-turn-helix domain-containing protein [Synergistaceae bacterium]|nr:helix-turn-helix domain-containing protein [Synergistaceae bacterium]
MDSISIYVGKKINFFRKQKNLSLDQLSSMIHKSKSTLSKYENGNISIDIETLCDIAKVLDVELNQLINYRYKPSSQSKFSTNPFGAHNDLYIYYYDGRKKSVVISFLTISFSEIRNVFESEFYMDIPSFDEYEKCQFYYVGEMNAFDLVTYLTMTNQTNPMERMSFCILNQFRYNSLKWGYMFGISYKPIAPFALKFLLSTMPLPMGKITPEALSFTNSEIKMIKKLNMLLLDTE